MKQHFAQLRACLLSGQIGEGQWQSHLRETPGLGDWCALQDLWERCDCAFAALSEDVCARAARGAPLTAAQSGLLLALLADAAAMCARARALAVRSEPRV